MLLCAEVSEEDFYVIHHEMGHIQYYMAYDKQPAIFKVIVCLSNAFADVSLHQWARRKTIKSSFQCNPGPTVFGGLRTTRLSDSSSRTAIIDKENFLILLLCETYISQV